MKAQGVNLNQTNEEIQRFHFEEEEKVSPGRNGEGPKDQFGTIRMMTMKK